MHKKLFALTFSLVAVAAMQAQALQITYGEMTNTKVTGEQAGGGAPADGDVYNFFVSTDADILSIGNVAIVLDNGAELYQNGFGSNTAPPNDLLIPTFPALAVDSYITTPGANTALLGADMPGDGTSTWGDLTDDGPVTDFLFAQLTVPAGTTGYFQGQVSINDGAGGAFTETFKFDLVPEPATFVLAGMGLLGLVAARRRMA